MLYKLFIRPLLFRLEAETAHHLAFFLLRIAFRIPGFRFLIGTSIPQQEPIHLLGLSFPNPVGLAAGFDKNATHVDLWPYLGFGFVEIGTVTPKPQAGNPRPRLFRLVRDRGIINRMGFNNDGVKAIAGRLALRKSRIIVGGNIGKNKDTPNENAVEDYIICFRELFDVVDYFVVNVSSPNTPNLRELQEKKPLTEILTALQKENRLKPKSKPILLKIAPDLSSEQLDDVAEIVVTTGIQGVVATNTTLDRSALHSSHDAIGAGGLSGAPLFSKATEVLRYLSARSAGKFAIIGVGGIFDGNTALEKRNAGAALVQIYSGFVFEGPRLVSEIIRAWHQDR